MHAFFLASSPQYISKYTQIGKVVKKKLKVYLYWEMPLCESSWRSQDWISLSPLGLPAGISSGGYYCPPSRKPGKRGEICWGLARYQSPQLEHLMCDWGTIFSVKEVVKKNITTRLFHNSVPGKYKHIKFLPARTCAQGVICIDFSLEASSSPFWGEMTLATAWMQIQTLHFFHTHSCSLIQW